MSHITQEMRMIGDPRTGTFPQKQVTAGDTACNVKKVSVKAVSNMNINITVYTGSADRN